MKNKEKTDYRKQRINAPYNNITNNYDSIFPVLIFNQTL